MELELAKAILNEAISGEFLEAMPEDDESIIEEAEYFAQQAEKEYNDGWGKGNETVVAIINLLPKEEPDNSPSSAQPESGVGTGSSAFFKELPKPQSNGIDPTSVEMPFDLSELDEVELRRYHGIFAHFFGRARYALAEEQAQLVAAEHLRDNALREGIVKAKRRDDTPKTLKLLESEAMQDHDFVSWNKNVLEHEQNVLKLKALAEIYSKNVEVLSREATIRQNEYERSR